MPNCDHLVDAPHFVYRCFDADGRLLYIGCTVDVERRLTAHRRSAAWFPLLASVRLVGPFVGSAARYRAMRAEERLIRAERPEFNAHHRRHLVLAEAAS